MAMFLWNWTRCSLRAAGHGPVHDPPAQSGRGLSLRDDRERSISTRQLAGPLHRAPRSAGPVRVVKIIARDANSWTKISELGRNDLRMDVWPDQRHNTGAALGSRTPDLRITSRPAGQRIGCHLDFTGRIHAFGRNRGTARLWFVDSFRGQARQGRQARTFIEYRDETINFVTATSSAASR